MDDRPSAWPALTATLAALPACVLRGQVSAVGALVVDVSGLSRHVAIGDRIAFQARDGTAIPAEIIGVRGGIAQAAPFATTTGLGEGAVAWAALSPGSHGASAFQATLSPCQAWLGRVMDPLGTPLDGLGPLPRGTSRPVRAAPPLAATRARLGPAIDTGVRVLNCFTTCRSGQRLGLFAGSGVGKSTLLSMLARNTACDVVVLALVGERGREVRDFLEDDLGEDGLARAVVVVATGDAPPLLRREAAYAALTVAEHFRDEGKSVLLLMDSVTRFCLALRELGLAAGEPPATRGYPPSVFAELPRLLERAGPGPELPDRPAGRITGLFTVLVEGGDHDEPVADAVRGILDGHVVLDRRIGEAGRLKPGVKLLRQVDSQPGLLPAYGLPWRLGRCCWLYRCRAFVDPPLHVLSLACGQFEPRPFVAHAATLRLPRSRGQIAGLRATARSGLPPSRLRRSSVTGSRGLSAGVPGCTSPRCS